VVGAGVAGPEGPALRIVYFGTPAFAVPTLRALLASRHAVCGVVTQPDRPRGRGQKVTDAPVKALAVEHGLPVYQPTSLKAADAYDTVSSWAPDLGVVAAYGRIIPSAMLELPRLGMINVHASLLPKYRGAAPVHRAVIDGEGQTGITIMKVVSLLDAGPMIAKATRPIGPDETSDVVERDLAELGAPLLVQVDDAMAAGPVNLEPQDDMMSTYAPRLTKDEGLMDWTLPAAYLHNRVRGLYPWPHAYTHLHGQRIIVLRSSADARATGAAPGTVVEVTREAIVVAAGFGSALALHQLQLEGKRPLAVREFLAGHPIATGAVFGHPPSHATAR
jgi:methionyl-tRNA formyltransferase